jgi:hypothetical protein
MSITFRCTENLIERVKTDFARPHPYAAERVGFISVRAAHGHENLVLLAQSYHPVADGDYLDDPRVGATMGPAAIRKALDIALLAPVGMFHVHVHEHRGPPRFSHTDLREQPKFVPDFFSVRRSMPHGAIVLSHDRAAGRCWLARDKIIDIGEFHVIGARIHRAGGGGR